jgi:hypothetical protein
MTTMMMGRVAEMSMSSFGYPNMVWPSKAGDDDDMQISQTTSTIINCYQQKTKDILSLTTRDQQKNQLPFQALLGKNH